ncbi:cupin domain-containing protein [Bosea sp. BK604]|uniref:cupin domain-containing protein n=1 Tax=Bosea sp. BK604 TaxID=2512180 RepID=UPI00104B2DD0|nr:cupin domain-containing protein [Bosea sp. BK604]TCR67520.1 cupin domain [Bosea sp. BK604]
MTARHITWTRDQASGRGEFEGAEFGSEVSIIFTRIDRPGEGPELHRHPYSETFIIRRGTVVFSDGISSFEASAGAVVVVPAGVPHRFTSKSEHLEMIDIHASGNFVTEWLDRPTESSQQAERSHAGHDDWPRQRA